jgi:hypothetical protein
MDASAGGGYLSVYGTVAQAPAIAQANAGIQRFPYRFSGGSILRLGSCKQSK